MKFLSLTTSIEGERIEFSVKMELCQHDEMKQGPQIGLLNSGER